ncbi:E3 ubiquitin-protein ligase LRSAM1 [Portunus trituberculatus]|uniref:E3 ubiquitin-protein ligase LRSAM1 n=1 Tax=Portunus trituberculatus TaxID=210409 RepID=A0A5B7DG81_PORTR|nr:E3 ubiquitin-protein ligase LRSAM1 [Portunus trituberculatus]
MKEALMEEAAAEQRRQAVQDEQGARVFALMQDADLVNSHLHGVLTTRLAEKEEWTSTLLKDEECQEAAFKLLLLNSDLKRNNILRQIGQIEFELARLSSLEVRKKKHGIKYGSSTMLEQRITLVGLLKCLMKEKSEREAQLAAWLAQLQDMRSGNEEEDEQFWLVQYQRLLSMKPVGLAEAEAKLEPGVQAVLKAANALDLTPVFAHNSITFSRLVDMTEEDAAAMDIGPATYRSLQRALQNYLYASKVGDHTPSAPSEEEYPYAPSAPNLESDEAAPSAPVLEGQEGMPTAPPIDQQFVEAECVVCMNARCEKTMAKVKVVKVEETGKDVGTKASDKKNKNEKKILKVISKRNGTDNASVPKKKKRNRGKKNKSNTNGIEASPETKNGESSPTIDEENSEPTNDISSSSVEKPMKEEPATTTSETPEAATKTTESGESEGPNTEGKKKRKRKNKRKASEALEGASESTDNKEDGSEDTAEGAKGIKRMKVEEEKDDAEEEKPKKKTKKMKAEKKGEDDAEGQSASKEKKQQQEKKYVLFMGNLPFELTEEEVREHFKIVADNIVRVTLLNRKKSGKSKGYGFIELKDADSYNLVMP